MQGSQTVAIHPAQSAITYARARRLSLIKQFRSRNKKETDERTEGNIEGAKQRRNRGETRCVLDECRPGATCGSQVIPNECRLHD